MNILLLYLVSVPKVYLILFFSMYTTILFLFTFFNLYNLDTMKKYYYFYDEYRKSIDIININWIRNLITFTNRDEKRAFFQNLCLRYFSGQFCNFLSIDDFHHFSQDFPIPKLLPTFFFKNYFNDSFSLTAVFSKLIHTFTSASSISLDFATFTFKLFSTGNVLYSLRTVNLLSLILAISLVIRIFLSYFSLSVKIHYSSTHPPNT